MSVVKRRLAAIVACLPLCLLAATATAAQAATAGGPVIIRSSHNDASAPLTSLAPPSEDRHQKVKPHRKVPGHENGHSSTPGSAPGSPTSVPSTALSFDGIGQGFSGPNGTFSVTSAPPDTNGATGLNHYVQTVNSDFAVWNKNGTVLYGPVPLNTLWSGFGGLCQTDNDGDPTVVYDRAADRFVISQFAVTGADGGATPFLQCVAVSQTGDPTGAYYRYSFPYSWFNDYPKMGVWPDAYYVTSNKFNAAGTTFLGTAVAAMDRAKMLTGQAATQQVFQTSTTYGGLLAATVDSAQAPPPGAPEHVVGLGSTTSTIATWNYHVDWTTPGNSTFTGPTELSVATYAEACAAGTCIPQSGTTQQLDSLADRLMNRLAYRNFGDHEAMVVDHSVTAGSSVGMRWYELRVAANAVSVFQQGTFAPDSNYRWMGSIAMDQAGNMALGYSVSSASMHPAIAYSGRLAGDPAGQMSQGEATIIQGGGSQSGQNLSRWGDYSSMTVDPRDDCTFWYTNEYIPATGAFNWKTRVGNFKFPGCGTQPPANDFSISATPASQTVNQGYGASYTVSTATTAGSPQAVTLSASGLPAGAAASFNPASVPSGGSSTMAVTTSTSTPAGTYPITVTGTGATTHTTTVSLGVNGPAGIVNGGFETGTFTGWTTAGTTSISASAHSGLKAAMVGGSAPTSGDSTVSQTFSAPNPSGSLTFWYNVVCPDTITYDWASATLKDNTAGTTSTLLSNTCTNSGAWVQSSPASLTGGHSYTLTLLSHDDNYSSDPTYTLFDDVALAAPPTPDFSISASPASQTVTQGGGTSYTVTVTAQNGFSGGVSLAASGLPAGASASFNPASVPGAGTSTMSVTTSGSTPPGSYPITIAGTSGSLSHSTGVTLVVNAAPTPDFTISASPASQSVIQGNGTSYTVTVTAQNGFTGGVSLAASALPAGASASFNPVSVAGSGTSVMSVTTAGTAPGSYPITVTGTSGSLNHGTSVTLVVNPPPDFIVSASPATQSVTPGNGTSYTVTVTAQNGFSSSVSLAASGLPAGAGATFNPTSVAGGGTSTMSVTTATTTPTGSSTLIITGTSGSLSHTANVTLVVNQRPANPIVNGGFETGDFTGWTSSGANGISQTAHSGLHSAQVGSSSPFNGDSTIYQTFNAPGGAGHTLSFWYQVVCTDTVTYDWATATLRDNTTSTTTTVLAKSCTNTGSWVQKTVSLTGGHSYTLTLINHDDNYASPPDPTYTLYDDISVS